MLSVVLFGLISLSLAISLFIYSPEYMRRIVKHGESDVQDYRIFPERIISRSDTPYFYPVEIKDGLGDMTVEFERKGKIVEKTLSNLLSESETTAFIIIHNDVVVLEQYFNGYNRESINTSFSAAKSIVSLLIGIAIEEGYIKSFISRAV